MKIGVCWKWVSLDGETEPDSRWAGVSAADEAALEVALRFADVAGAASCTVHVVCLGPAGADSTLRRALAAGASRASRIDASPELDGRVVAEALAARLADCDLVVCGDYSVDRGTGSVPAFIAGDLRAAQALGLVEVIVPESIPATIRVRRRLDGGRREILDVPLPAVLSVEGGVADLRRAALASSIDSLTAPVDVVTGPAGHAFDADVRPYRPRTRTVRAPEGNTLERVRDLLEIGGIESHAETVTLDPPAAAARIVEQLRTWGYVEPRPDTG